MIADENRQKRGVGDKNPLLVCRCCFDKSTEILSSGGHSSFKKNKLQLQRAKKRNEAEKIEIFDRKGNKIKQKHEISNVATKSYHGFAIIKTLQIHRLSLNRTKGY